MKSHITVFVLVFCCLSSFSYAASADGTAVKLNEVVVTATKTEQDIEDITQSVTVITADEIWSNDCGGDH